MLTILKDVEDEVYKSNRLKNSFLWFDNPEIKNERVHKRLRLSANERSRIDAMTSVLRSHVLENASSYTTKGRSPPSHTDCFCLAFGEIRPAIVATDDLGMHQLADEFEIKVFHCHEVLHKMLSAKMIGKAMVSEIYHALELKNDLPRSWIDVKHTTFKKVFGAKPKPK